MSTQPVGTPDWYQVLGVSPQASGSQIARAYRAGLRAYHPDTRLADTCDRAQAGVADTALRQLHEVYAVLGHPARRAVYDRRRVDARAPIPTVSVHVHPAARAGWDDPPPIRAGPVHWHP